MTSEDKLSANEVIVVDPRLPPLVRQMTPEDELSANEVIVVDPTSTTPSIAGLTVNLAEVVTIGVASSADLAEVVTVGVASSADCAEVVTTGVSPSAAPDGEVIAGMTSMEEYGEHDVLPSDVALPPFDPDDSSAELETIVVGAAVTGAPWFLTGLAEGDRSRIHD